MKKILSMIWLVCALGMAQAQTVMHVVWPFSLSSSDSEMVQALIASANANQTQYKFVFQSRQGAGGAVAAQHVASNSDNHILLSSSSFYVRPQLFRESHDPSQFAMIASVCYGKPLAVLSRKFASVQELKGQTFSLGINAGSITQLVSRQLQANTEAVINEIPYKGTADITVDLLGGHLDAGVDHVGKTMLAKISAATRVSILGITGTVNHQGLPTFKSQGIKGLENLVNNYNIYAHQSMPMAQQQELNQILSAAISDKVSANCESDFAKVVKMTLKQAERTHKESMLYWQSIAQGISKQ